MIVDAVDDVLDCLFNRFKWCWVKRGFFKLKLVALRDSILVAECIMMLINQWIFEYAVKKIYNL